MSGAALVRIISADEGQLFDFRGAQIRRKVSASEAMGRWTLTVGTQPPNFENSPHVHLHEPEAFFILEGEYQFHTAEGDVPVGPGSLVFIPPGALHGFRTGPAGGRVIGISPAAFDGYFEDMRSLFAAGMDTPETMAAVAQAHDMDAYPAGGKTPTDEG